MLCQKTDMHFKPFLTAIAATTLFMSTSLPALPLSSGTPHWECVPIARLLSGIEIRGNALTWWGQAEGRYARGAQPKRGAVLAFKPYGSMVLGHVAAVSRVVDDRTILVTHSNWSPINGRKGQIERDVKVVDVSDDGDWSSVRVWYAPMQDLGTTAWPVHGFIYPDHKAPMRLPDEVAPAAAPVLAYAKVSTSTQVSDNGPRPTGRLNYLAKILKR
jgi:surface antigen